MLPIHPGTFFRDNYPNCARAAEVVGIVYDNLDRIFKYLFMFLEEDTSTRLVVESQLLLSSEKEIGKARVILGYFKPSTQGAEEQRKKIQEFNQMLKDLNVSPNNFSGGEISDAEHFYTSAMLASIHWALSDIGSSLWDIALEGVILNIKNGTQEVTQSFGPNTNSPLPGGIFLKRRKDWEFSNALNSQLDQVIGPNDAGKRYAMLLTELKRIKIAAQSSEGEYDRYLTQ